MSIPACPGRAVHPILRAKTAPESKVFLSFGLAIERKQIHRFLMEHKVAFIWPKGARRDVDYESYRPRETFLASGLPWFPSYFLLI